MIVFAALVALALAGVVYWLLVLSEGTYLGTRVVALLYDWTARRYDQIKDLRYVDETRFIGIPLVEALKPVAAPRVVDIATGTGRVPLALARDDEFAGTVVGLDRSARMLAEAQRAVAEVGERIVLMQGDASALPFGDETLDCVTCLEAMEFMTRPAQVTAEMVRVLKPGGVLLLSNRVGQDAWYFPGRMAGRGRLERHLQTMGLRGVTMQRWQVHYDLVWARKARVAE